MCSYVIFSLIAIPPFYSFESQQFWRSIQLLEKPITNCHIIFLNLILGFHPWISFLDFILRFLAMAELKRALFCSSGLTKTVDFLLRFLDQYVVINKLAISHPFPHREVSPFQFPCSSHFVPSLSAKFWDLMRIHW